MAVTFETRNRRHRGSCPNESTAPIRSYSVAMPANSRRAWPVRSGSMACEPTPGVRGGRRWSRGSRRASRSTLEVLGPELAGPNEHAREPRGLGAEDVALEVVADHRGTARRHADLLERRGEVRLRRLAAHRRAPAGRLLEPGDVRPAVELPPLGGAPVQVAMHRDQLGAVHQHPEDPVHRRVVEALVRARRARRRRRRPARARSRRDPPWRPRRTGRARGPSDARPAGAPRSRPRRSRSRRRRPRSRRR